VTTVVSLERPQLSVRGRIDDAVARARQLGRTTLLSHVEQLPFAPDPVAFLAASSAALDSGTLWEQPAMGLAFAGAGSACEIRATGPGRLGQVSAAMRDLQSGLVRDDSSIFPCLGGFAFSEHSDRSHIWRDFPGARFVIPQVLIQNDGHDALLRVTIKVEPRSSPSEVEQLIDDLLQHARRWVQVPLSLDVSHSRVRVESFPNRTAWESSVATAVALIRQGALDKLVLAREEQLLAAIPFSPITALARLRRFNSAATLFAMQSGRSWLLGASPERLVRLHENRVDVTCLAGSIGMGHDDEERRHLADQLLSSKKDREEHEIVVRSTMCALAEVCEDVTRLAGTPRIATARAVQHLETPVSARMSDAGNILNLVERLHPTPAVGGYPSDRALSIMRELEEIDRGWYAGPFGWTDLDGSGEFVVAIRSALLSGRMASLFAGSGIVADSVPSAEYEETCLKLRPMLSALGAA
jgi:menaquinone-specific isochorismate synthase